MNSLRVSLLLACAGSACFAADHNWLIGQVIDANATRSIVQTGTTYQANTYGSATATTNGSTYGNQYSATTQVSGQSTTFGNAQAHHTIFQDNQIVIQGADYLYGVDDVSQKAVGLPTYGWAARAIANRKHGCRMIVGDSIRFEQVKDKIFVQDADGKVCKLDITRQERIVTPQTASAAR